MALICVSCAGASCVLPFVRKRATQVRETALLDTLSYMRKAIKGYSAQKHRLPRALDDLVDAGFLPKIPVDPVTDETKWQVVIGDQLNGSKVKPGVVDVHSYSTAKSSRGNQYSEW